MEKSHGIKYGLDFTIPMNVKEGDVVLECSNRPNFNNSIFQQKNAEKVILYEFLVLYEFYSPRNENIF